MAWRRHDVAWWDSAAVADAGTDAAVVAHVLRDVHHTCGSHGRLPAEESTDRAIRRRMRRHDGWTDERIDAALARAIAHGLLVARDAEGRLAIPWDDDVAPRCARCRRANHTPGRARCAACVADDRRRADERAAARAGRTVTAAAPQIDEAGTVVQAQTLTEEPSAPAQRNGSPQAAAPQTDAAGSAAHPQAVRSDPPPAELLDRTGPDRTGPDETPTSRAGARADGGPPARGRRVGGSRRSEPTETVEDARAACAALDAGGICRG